MNKEEIFEERSMQRYKCPQCGSIRVELYADNGGSWRADLICGKCGVNINEFGV